MNYQQAREKMAGFCRVCSTCNGRACAGEVPGMGGTGSGSSFMANVDALSQIKFKMRVLKNTQQPSTKTQLLGLDLDIPVLAAPIGGASFNMCKDADEYQYISSLLKGCAAEGVIGCTGDGVPAFVHQSAYKAIEEVSGKGIPFIKPWQDDIFLKKVEGACATGATVMGIDVDSIGLSTVNLMGSSIPLRTFAEFAKLRSQIPLKVILKGIMVPEEAQMAVDMGADAIIVSNHGGRVLDCAQGTAEVLPEIVQAVGGKLPILVDGGIRTGADVLKMLALGADAVLIGRPLSISVFSDFDNGVSEYLKKIKKELIQSMLLTGCSSIEKIDSSILA